MSTPASANQLPGWVYVVGAVGIAVCLYQANRPTRPATPTAPYRAAAPAVPVGLKSSPGAAASQPQYIPPPRGPVTVPCPNSQCYGGLVTNINGPNTVCGVCGGRGSVTRY